LNISEPTIRINVDAANPGQFFACCGLLELASRMWSGAEGWFEGNRFNLGGNLSSKNEDLATVVGSICCAVMDQVDPLDDFSSPIRMGSPFDLTLDWWMDSRSGGNRLKVWAGSMRSVRIARAMRVALQNMPLRTESFFDDGMVVFDPDEPDKKVEPYYFDGRRGNNAQSRDIGFAPDALHMTTAAYPAVEFLCLVGLQRFRPMPTDLPRVFEYNTWNFACEPLTASVMACGLSSQGGVRRYRFENAFRTDQRKHKAFLPATYIGGFQ